MESHFHSDQLFDLIVIGGGAAGFMAAITAAENGLKSILILEATSKALEKVRISGGGRCNVTNACWDPKDLVFNYPRGTVPLLGPFTRFAPGDSVSWFAERGVDLVIEPDGRMFPIENNSSAIVSCLKNSAKRVGVELKRNILVELVKKTEENVFLVKSRRGDIYSSKCIVVSTGGHPSGHKIAAKLGHKVIASVPSLFTFALDCSKIVECSGIALDDIKITLIANQNKFTQIGRILITHWGLSGPAILKLSAFAARDLYKDKYKSELIVSWTPLSAKEIENLFQEKRDRDARRTLGSKCPIESIPKNLWLAILEQVEINPLMRWAEFPIRLQRLLINALTSSHYSIKGKGPFGEEFVTAGGVELSEVNLLTMQSKLCNGLYFAGEVLNVDGITGGFNFQHCWTSGWLSGVSIAKESSSL